MFQKINKRWTMTIPALSFITIFSSPFLNREKHLSYVANTGLFRKELAIDIKQLSTFNYTIRTNTKQKKLLIWFIANDDEFWTNANGDIPMNFFLHNIEFVFITFEEFAIKMNRNSLPSERDSIFILCEFNSWHYITKNIFLTGLQMNEGENCGVVISGGDSSKRHLVSPLSIKLHSFLLRLTGFNSDWLVNNVLYNIDKKFLVPQFNLQEINHPYIGGAKTSKLTEKKKKNLNLHTDLSIVTDSIKNVNNSVTEQSNEDIYLSSLKEKKIYDSILDIPSTQKESLPHNQKERFSSVNEKINNSSFDPNQKINYHISSSPLTPTFLMWGTEGRMKTNCAGGPLVKVGYFSSMSGKNHL